MPEAFATTGPIGGLAVHAGWVYWTSGAEVLRQPVDGGLTAREVLASAQSSAGPMMADADGVFWFDRDAGKVWHCPLTGACTPTLLASGPAATANEAIGIGLDRDNVYWSAYRAGGDGGVFGTSKDGGPLQAISMQSSAKYVVADSVNVYWLTNCGGAFSRKKDRTLPEAPLAGFTACTSGQGGLALSANALFIGGNELVRIPLGAGPLAKVAVPEIVRGLATDCANAVYWTQMVDGIAALVTLPESAFLADGGVDIGARVTLAADTSSSLIVAAESGLYWAGNSTIMRLVSKP